MGQGNQPYYPPQGNPDDAMRHMQVSPNTPPVTFQAPALPDQALRTHASMAVGAVSIEERRAVEEIRAKILIAKSCPRRAVEYMEAIRDACSRPALAAKAIFSYPKGGATVIGPSIRLAEELARTLGNIEYGIRELSQDNGRSEMQAFCWDLERNVISTHTFIVKHEIGTKQGPKKLTDTRDVYEIGANMAARRMRARILAIIPPDIVEYALNECRRTLAGEVRINFAEHLQAVIDAFRSLGVSRQHIEARCKKKIEALLPEEIVELRGIYNSIKDGTSKTVDYFSDTSSNSLATLNNEIENLKNFSQEKL
jgi:hypothetical protein